MITIRRSAERGRTKIDWLDSFHSFSFADYYDPHHMHFGPLRVINEDIVAPGAGFPPHPHRDMEIVTYILSGALAHKDSLGTGSVIRPGEIQRMSAGSGIVHSEFNASPADPVHLMQIWIVPSRGGIAPSYEQKAIAPQSMQGRFVRIAAPDPGDSEVRLMQDAEIWAGRFASGEGAGHAIKPGRGVWLQVAAGSIDLSGRVLGPGDAAAITEEEQVLLRAVGDAEVLLFDLGL